MIRVTKMNKQFLASRAQQTWRLTGICTTIYDIPFFFFFFLKYSKPLGVGTFFTCELGYDEEFSRSGRAFQAEGAALALEK